MNNDKLNNPVSAKQVATLQAYIQKLGLQNDIPEMLKDTTERPITQLKQLTIGEAIMIMSTLFIGEKN